LKWQCPPTQQAARSEDMVVEDNADNCLEPHLDAWTSASSDHVVVELDMCED